jgi:hypothetical protein
LIADFLDLKWERKHQNKVKREKGGGRKAYKGFALSLVSEGVMRASEIPNAKAFRRIIAGISVMLLSKQLQR